MRIGKTQISVLRSLREYKGWCRGCGWLWDTPKHTERIMDKLVKKGLANKSDEGDYRISLAGTELLFTHGKG